MYNDNEITKHLGEQAPLTQTQNQDNKPPEAENGGRDSSNPQVNNPLKPEETQKGITPEKGDKK